MIPPLQISTAPSFFHLTFILQEETEQHEPISHHLGLNIVTTTINFRPINDHGFEAHDEGYLRL